MRNARSRIRFETVRVAAALLLAWSVLAPARASDVTGFADWTSTDGTLRRDEVGEDENRERFDAFRQRYNVTWDVRPGPAFRVLLGGLFDRTDQDRELTAALVSSRQTRFRPFADLSLRTPQVLAQVNFSRLDDREDVGGLTSLRTLRDSLTASLGWNATDDFPRVRLQYLWTDSRDGDRSLLDATENLTQLFVEHRAWDRLGLQYRGSLQELDNKVEQSRVRNTAHNGRVSYADRYWGGRVQLNADYNVNWRRTETLSSGGEVDFPQFPLQGLSALDDTPGAGPLDPNPALVDGNREVSAGINLGLPPIGGDDRPRNLGLLFGDPIEINTLRVWLDRELDFPIAASLTWRVFVSDDNDVWALLPGGSTTTYDRFESRFDVRFESTAARYFKLVVEPLGETAPDASNWPEILVTELEGILRLRAEDVDRKTDSTFHLYNMAARTRLLRDRALYHELTYLFRKAGEQASTWTLSNGLSLSQPLGDIYSLTARVAREDGQERGAERVAYVYSTSLQATPVERLRYNLVLSGYDQERVGIREDRTSLYFYTIAELYRGIDVNFGIGRTYLTDTLRRKSRTDQINAVATFVPQRWWVINLILQDRTTTRLSGPPISDDFTRAEEIAVTFNPLPTVYLYGSFRREDRTDLGKRDIRSVALSWSPFPYGNLRLSVRYNETYRTDSEQTEQVFIPSLRWDINPRWFLQVDYQQQITDNPLERNERNVLTATTRITF